MELGAARSLLIPLDLRRSCMNVMGQRSTHIYGFPEQVYMTPVGTMHRFPMMTISAGHASREAF